MTDKVDMRGIINELLRQGRIDGFIPLDELQRICKEYSLSTEKFEEVKLKIQAANIDLVESHENDEYEQDDINVIERLWKKRFGIDATALERALLFLQEVWTKTSRTKGNKVFEGYIVCEYYLLLPEEIKTESVKADKENYSEPSFIQDIFAEAQEKALLLVDEISKKSAELAVALEEVKKREGQVIARDNDSRKENIRLQQWQSRLNSKQADVDRKEKENKEKEYSLHMSIFSKTFCKDSLIKLYGKDYWLELIQKMYELGEEIGKSELQVKIDLDCYLVDIYMCFNMYEEAYEVFCIQAEHSSWLHTHTLEDVVKQSGHWAKLKGILEKRVYEGKDYRECLDKLKSLGY